MADVTRTFTVRAPLGTVMGYLADWGNTVEWDPGTVTCTRLGDGPVGVGAEWRNVLRLLHRDTTMVFRLERLEDRRLVFLGRNRGATTTDTITCTPRGADEVSIEYHAHVVFHGLSRLVGPIIRWEVGRIGDALVGQMTTALERRG